MGDKQAERDVFASGGVMGAAVRDLDWSSTALGAIETWPQSLRSIVNVLLTSRFAMWMGWGSALTLFYNDAYIPTLGVKHPGALGRPVTEVWSEIWADIGPLVDHVMSTGQAAWQEGMLLFLERSGYPEETYHTFSYSPLRDDNGAIAGNFCVVSEETDRIIGERRLRTLSELSAGLTDAITEPQVLEATRASLSANDRDLPFSLVYLWDDDGLAARLASCTGFRRLDDAAAVFGDTNKHGPWPQQALWDGAARAETALPPGQFAGLPTGFWANPPGCAMCVPIGRQGQEHPAGFLVIGLNPHRALDTAYADFATLIAGQIASGIASARAHESERRRAEALAELDRAKTAFFSNVSHEFRTPLTLMLGPLEEALAAPADGEIETIRPLIDLGTRNAHRLLRLVNSLLDFSRVEAGRVQARFRPIDLAAFSAEIAASFRSVMERAGLSFEIDCLPLDEPVFVDSAMWEKIVLNLLSNAFKFTLQGGVRLTLRRDGHCVALRVEDTGTGISADQLPLIFDRFHRVEGSRGRSFEGSGIGLALVRDLAQVHGGDVSVQSEPGKGSVFTVTVPFGAAHLPQALVDHAASAESSGQSAAFIEEAMTWLAGARAPAETPPRLDAPPAPVAHGQPGGTILLADDNADMRRYLTRLLTQAGYSVTVAGDGEAALEEMRRVRPDLVLSDVMMPRLDGLGMLRDLRADTALREIPVILLSARAGEDSQLAGLDRQADDYLAKPFSASELLARVRSNLAMARLRRAAADEARASEARYRALVDASTNIVWRATNAGEMFDAAGWLDFTGQSDVDMRGAGWLNMIHPDDRAGLISIFTTHLQSGTASDAVYRILHRSGEYRWVHARGVPVRGADGYVQEWIGTVTDIHDRRMAEAALTELNQTLEGRVAERTAERDRLWERSEDLLVLAGYDGTLLRISPSWTKTLGYSEAELLATNYLTLIHPDDREQTDHVLQEMVRSGTPGRVRIRMRAQDGSFKWIAWVSSPDQNSTSAFGVGRDITEEREAAEALAAANRDLREQIEERERVEATLRQMQRLEAVGQLTSGVAHDFNNLLTVVLGNIEYVSRTVTDNAAVRRLGVAKAAAQRGASLTSQLLAFSRKQRLEPKQLNLNDAVTGMTELLRSTIGSAVRVETALSAAPCFAMVDQTQLELVILNLAINARDAMQLGGTITIRTSNVTLGPPDTPTKPEAGDYVMVSVADTGTGIPPELLDRVFEPFFTTKEPGKGSGLGLAQVFGFAKQSGGGVAITTHPGEGTTVQVFLPRAAGETESVGQIVHAPLEGAAPGEPRILVVDDDRDVRDITRCMLEDLGCRVVEAASGPAALGIFRGDRAFDAVLIDFAMPGMNGDEVAREIDTIHPGTPIVFITGFPDGRLVKQAGHRPVLSKPFAAEKLAQALRAVIRVGAMG